LSNYRYIPMSYFDSLADAQQTLRENSLTALRLQLDLLEWLERSASMPAYQNFITTYGHRRIDEEGGTRSMLGEYLHRQVKDVAATGSTHYVSANMSEVIKCAAVDMPATGLRPNDLPTDTGWLVFERPVGLFMGDGSDTSRPRTEVRIAALGWQVGTVRRAPLSSTSTEDPDASSTLVPGISYYLFQTAHDAAVFRNTLAEQDGYAADHTESDIRQQHGPLPIFDFSGWAYNTPWHSVTSEELAGYSDEDGAQNCHSIVDQARRLLLATWRIFRQKKIIERDNNTPPRHMRRQAQRVGYEPEHGDIVIIRMRTEVYRDLERQARAVGQADGTWYHCQFLVRGHWHPYWTGPQAHCDRHNLVPVPNSDDLICTHCGRTLVDKYILPYPKGNPEGPLILRDRIFDLDR
jgi:hypothetical protein